jgi:hypothetical protein
MSMTTSTNSTADLQNLVEESAHDACVKLFDAYGVVLQDVDPNVGLDEALLLTSIIGFTGPGLRGTCILASTEGPLERSNPTSGSLRDWIAELVNQLVGRVKNLLLHRGAEVYVTTPVVIRGEHLAPLPRFVLKPQAFAAVAGGKVFLWVEVEAAPDFRLAEPLPPPAAEGETLLF